MVVFYNKGTNSLPTLPEDLMAARGNGFFFRFLALRGFQYLDQNTFDFLVIWFSSARKPYDILRMR